MQQQAGSLAVQWPSLAWEQPGSMRSSFQELQASGTSNHAGPMRAQKLVLQANPTGLGMQISYARPAEQPDPPASAQNVASGQPVHPRRAVGPQADPVLSRSHSTGSSTFSTETVGLQHGADSKVDVKSFYAQDRAAAAARPRKAGPSFRQQRHKMWKLRSSEAPEHNPEEQHESVPHHDAYLSQEEEHHQQRDAMHASMYAESAVEAQHGGQDGLDLLMLVIQATEQAEAAAAAEAAQRQQHPDNASLQGQHAPGASAMHQAGAPSQAGLSSAHPVSRLPDKDPAAPASKAQGRQDESATLDAHMRNAIAAALAAVEDKAAPAAGQHAGVKATRSSAAPPAAGTAEAMCSRPKRAAARDADIVRQVAMQQELQGRRQGHLAGIKHTTVDERLKSLEVAAKLHRQRRKQQHAQKAALPPIPPKKRRHTSPVSRKRSHSAVPGPQLVPAPMPGPLAPASAHAVAVAAAEAEAAARRVASQAMDDRPAKRFKFAEAGPDIAALLPAPASPSGKRLSGLQVASHAAGGGAAAARAALAAAYAGGSSATPSAKALLTVAEDPAAATTAGAGNSFQQQQQSRGAAAAMMSPKASCSLKAATAAALKKVSQQQQPGGPGPSAPAATTKSAGAAGLPAAAAVQVEPGAAGRPLRRVVSARSSGPKAAGEAPTAAAASAEADAPQTTDAAAADRPGTISAKGNAAVIGRGAAAAVDKCVGASSGGRHGKGKAAALQGSRTRPLTVAAAAVVAVPRSTRAVVGGPKPAPRSKPAGAAGKVKAKPAGVAVSKAGARRGHTLPAAATPDSSSRGKGDTSSDGDSSSSSSDESEDDDDESKAASKPKAAARQARTSTAQVVAAASTKTGPKGGRPLGAANKHEMAPRNTDAEGKAAFNCRSKLYRGVYMCQRLSVRWRTQFSYGRKVLNVGSYPTEEAAARAWNAAAMHFRGGDCWVNPVEPVLPEDEGLAIAHSLPQPEGGSKLPAARKQAGK